MVVQSIHPPWTKIKEILRQMSLLPTKLKLRSFLFLWLHFFCQLARDYILPHREVIRHLLNVSFGKMTNCITNAIVPLFIPHSASEIIFHPSELCSRSSHNIFSLNAHKIREPWRKNMAFHIVCRWMLWWF